MTRRDATSLKAALERPLVRVALATAAGTALAVALAYYQFPAAGNDDTHITYWVAYALSKFGTLVNYNGDHVEQSSSLAFVVLLTLFGKLTGLEPPTLGWLMSIAFGILTLVAAARLALRIAPRAAAWCPLFLGSWLPFLYWSTSGMEMTLAALLGCLTADTCGSLIDGESAPKPRDWVSGGLAMLGLALVRPETPVVLACALLLSAVVHGVGSRRGTSTEANVRLRRALTLLGAGVAMVLLLALVRYLVFGLVVPNSAAAKTGAFAIGNGASYLSKGIALSGIVLAAAGIGGMAVTGRAVLAGRVQSAAVLVVGLALASIAFVLKSGGDWMPGARLLVPLAPLLAVLATSAVDWAGKRQRIVAAGLAALVVVFNVRSVLEFGQSRSNGSYSGSAAFEGQRALVGPSAPEFAFSELGNKAHRRDARLLGVLLDIAARLRPTRERPLYLMSGQAGMVPYYVFREHYGAARFIDLYGITNREILSCIPREERRAVVQGVRIGANYVIRHADQMDPGCRARRPDVFFSTGRFPSDLRKLGYVKVYQGPRDMEAFIALDKDDARTLGFAEAGDP